MSTRTIRGIALMILTLCLMFVASAALAADGYVNTNALVLRKSASKDSKALQTLDKDDKMTILAVEGDWYKVSYGKYTGYVMSKYVKVSGELPTPKPTATPKPTEAPKPAATTAPTKAPSSSSSNSSSGSGSSSSSSSSGSASSPRMTAAPQNTSIILRPGDVSGSVMTMQTSLKALGYYGGKLDGVYGTSTENAVRAFQKQSNLKQDGIAGPKTLTALYQSNNSGSSSDSSADSSSSASSAASSGTKTESLDWFKNGDSAIPRGAEITIKDVATGKTFKAKRWAGASHCDTEPMSSADTAIMKEIYGGSWSWTRRAILVSYNGHVYAASMNGMPHGTSTRNNGFSGHFCIHFTGSKTHGTDRVDEDHQSAVQKALKNSW